MNLCVQNSIRSDRQFTQSLAFDIQIYDTPVRLNAFYNAFIYYMKVLELREACELYQKYQYYTHVLRETLVDSVNDVLCDKKEELNNKDNKVLGSLFCEFLMQGLRSNFEKIPEDIMLCFSDIQQNETNVLCSGEKCVWPDSRIKAEKKEYQAVWWVKGCFFKVFF